LGSLVILAVTAAIGGFLLDSTRTREIAIEICQAACIRQQVQFLDQTVALNRLGLRWPPQGLRIRRVYCFDFNEEAIGRHTGHIVMLGRELQELSLGLPSQPDDI
jgi:hypothetical protein